MKRFEQRINELISYGLQHKLIDPIDVDYCVNRLLYLFKMDELTEPISLVTNLPPLAEILHDLTEFALERGIIEMDLIDYRDQFDTEIMNCLMPSPSVIANTFWTLFQHSPVAATNYFYHIAKASNYIRMDRIERNVSWTSKSKYGMMIITINLAKPEKDPRVIALQKKQEPINYPKCVLCKENVGYHGRINHPPRANHRIIPIKLNEESWYLQYSPYVYYEEHCIVLSEKHVPMKINRKTFKRLLEFVKQFPHYFIGSNADLPIVGGSILSHDHYQGGRAELPMTFAEDLLRFKINGVDASILNWPLSVIRLKHSDIEILVDLATRILDAWREYSDVDSNIISETNGEPHNTVTPIARFRKEFYELDLVLRNNRTTDDYPLGIFHPHEEHHHIKKENIGLIEAMGCAILPARLKEELHIIEEGLLGKRDLNREPLVEKHLHWVEEIQSKHDIITESNVQAIIRQEVGIKFTRILEQCGVFPPTKKGLEAFRRFLLSTNLAISDYTELSR